MQRSRRANQGLLKRTEGATAVEFAITLPLLLLIVCGVIDFGRVYNEMHTVNEAAREGARLAAVGNNSQAVTAAVQAFGNQLTVVMQPTTPVSNNPVTVTVTSSVQIITPVVSAFFPSNPFPVVGRTVMQVE